MIRTKGFAGKTRRLTKGGSLSARGGGFGHSILRYLSGKKLPEAPKKERLSHDAVIPFSRNGASEHNGSNGSVEASARARAPRNDKIADFLETVIASLNSSGRNGEGSLDLSSDLIGLGCVQIPRWKRVLDLTCIFLTLPCWLPLMILLMAWIRIASAGPAFYRQERIGHRRDRFMIFKFRTMYVNAETRTHEEYFAYLMRSDCPMTKLDAGGDSRLIAGGRFLRASGLDELPQIFNVLRGEMSLVGPRPCLPNEFEQYEAWQQARVNVLPGLTGYWQVNGKNNTTFREMIGMDIFYGYNMSLWLDLVIILKTIPALIGQTIESRGQNGGNGAIVRQAISDESLNGSVNKL